MKTTQAIKSLRPFDKHSFLLAILVLIALAITAGKNDDWVEFIQGVGHYKDAYLAKIPA
jgi:hypothetical protein